MEGTLDEIEAMVPQALAGLKLKLLPHVLGSLDSTLWTALMLAWLFGIMLAAAFAVVLRIFFTAFKADVVSDDWSMIFAVLAALTYVTETMTREPSREATGGPWQNLKFHRRKSAT